MAVTLLSILASSALAQELNFQQNSVFVILDINAEPPQNGRCPQGNDSSLVALQTSIATAYRLAPSEVAVTPVCPRGIRVLCKGMPMASF